MTGGSARHLSEPAFPDDDGSMDRRLAEASDQIERLAVIGAVRLLVPVVAIRGDVPADGDKESEMGRYLPPERMDAGHCWRLAAPRRCGPGIPRRARLPSPGATRPERPSTRELMR